MSKSFLTVTLPTILLAAGVFACTDVTTGGTAPDRGPGAAKPLQAQLRSNAAKYFEAASKPREVKRANLFKDDKRQLGVTDFTASIGKKSGKAIEASITCTAKVGNGNGHEIVFTEQIQPMMSDEENVSVVTDKTTGTSRTYRMDQELQRFTVSDAGQQLSIVTNPDGSYTINGKPAATPADAAKLIVATDLGKNTSVESLVAIEATLLERRKATLALCGGGATGPQEDPVDLVDAVIDELMKKP